MKLPILCTLLFVCTLVVQAQTLVGLKLSFGGTLTAVKDKDTAPSGASTTGFATNPADGETTLEKSGGSVGLAFTIDLPVSEKIHLATGLNFYSKAFTLRNRDGSYQGISSFGLTYLQIPIAAKVYVKEVNDKIGLYAKFGPTLDLKIKEKLKGGDGAHFWNLATNDFISDPSRGRNGDNKPMPLFGPINIGLLFGFGAEYKIAENIVLNAAINYNPSFLNMLNHSLKLNDQQKTRVGELLKVRTSVLVVEIGGAFAF